MFLFRANKSGNAETKSREGHDHHIKAGIKHPLASTSHLSQIKPATPQHTFQSSLEMSYNLRDCTPAIVHIDDHAILAGRGLAEWLNLPTVVSSCNLPFLAPLCASSRSVDGNRSSYLDTGSAKPPPPPSPPTLTPNPPRPHLLPDLLPTTS